MERPINEDDWLSATSSDAMLAWGGFEAMCRKFGLFVCACGRQVWPLMADDRSRAMIEAAERFANGPIG